MPLTTLEFTSAASSSSDRIEIGSAAMTVIDVGAPRGVRLVPAPQAYYWTEAWQQGEVETLASLAVGNGRRFGDVDGLIDWLHADNEG